MHALDAAQLVLNESGKPLHISEITRRMIERGLWQTQGQTPEMTVNSVITRYLHESGPAARVQKVGKRIYQSLTATNGALTSGTAAVQDLPSLNADLESRPLVLPTRSDRAELLSFTDAAEQVLERFGRQQPMHYQSITRHALELGLIATAGQTPAATMYAVILTEIDRLTKRGEQPRFVKIGRGMVGLTTWSAQNDELVVLIDKHNREVRSKLHAHLHTMKPVEFEALIGRLLTALGFDSVAVTPLGGDGGIDVRGILVVGDVIRTRMAVQVKRWRRNVQAPTVQQVRGSLGAHEQGLIMTTSDFSKGARDEAARPDATPVALMDGAQLVNLLIEHDIGVRRSSHDLIKFGEEEDV